MLSFGTLILVIISIVIVVFITQLLWNFVMPKVFGLPEIEFWQTIALLILTQLFFGGCCNTLNAAYMNNTLS